MAFSTVEDFDQAYASVQAAFASGVTRNKEWRRHQLKRAWWMIEDNKDRICNANYEDLHKHVQETLMSDCIAIQADILHTLEKLDQWTQDERPARANILNFLGGATIRKEPLGVTLIIGAWNFPFMLSVQPMIAAIAAGCAIILKPSDVAVACQDLLMDMIPKYMDTSAIRCVSAGPQEMKYILDHRFNHIFFTGSSSVGKIVHAAAAKHLTPVTLELGGQGPAIVTKSANIDLAAKRIAATKFMNAGQICLNVNHVLVDPSVREAFVTRMGYYFDIFMEGKEKRPEYYTHVISDRNFSRLNNLLQKTSGSIAYGGDRDPKTRFFAPTIVVGVKPDDFLLSEEIFGPILPVIDADLDAAIDFTCEREHPLAIYAFSEQAADKARILGETQSGGITFNDCVLHVAAQDVPFGGIGNSGVGSYHGPYGILTFSHLRTYIDAMPNWMEGLMGARYPPYTVEKAHKLSPSVKAPFDRDGNDIVGIGGFAKWGVALAVLSSTAWVLVRKSGL